MDSLMEQAEFHTGWGGTINTQVTQCEVHWESGGRIPQEILWNLGPEVASGAPNYMY